MSSHVVPVWAMVHLTHAALQDAAIASATDLLHMKGPTRDPSLRSAQRDSWDADILVRPAHLENFVRALTQRGWRLVTEFDEGSSFGHAANFEHPTLAYADVHRLLPGPRTSPEVVFERLWRDRSVAFIAHFPCPVASVPGQVLIQSLHAARSHGTETSEAWTLAQDDVRAEVRELAAELDAEVALAAGIGELESFAGAPGYAMWDYWSHADDDRIAEWRERLRAAAGIREKLGILVRASKVNRSHLRIRLEREPETADIVREHVARVGRLAVSLAGNITRRARGR